MRRERYFQRKSLTVNKYIIVFLLKKRFLKKIKKFSRGFKTGIIAYPAGVIKEVKPNCQDRNDIWKPDTAFPPPP